MQTYLAPSTSQHKVSVHVLLSELFSYVQSQGSIPVVYSPLGRVTQHTVSMVNFFELQKDHKNDHVRYKHTDRTSRWSICSKKSHLGWILQVDIDGNGMICYTEDPNDSECIIFYCDIAKHVIFIE